MEDKILLITMNQKKILIFIALLSALVFTSVPAFAGWLIYHKPALKGKVIDAETKEPIEGAVVVVTYSKETLGIPHKYSSIINVRETLTDKNGEFYIPRYITMIQPLSFEGMANFIIFKPGYGSFPNYQTVPSGIPPIDQETFFLKNTGSEGELEMWVKEEKGPVLKISKVTFGVVELPKLKTREERIKASMVGITEYRSKDLPLLYKALNEEERYLGIPERE